MAKCGFCNEDMLKSNGCCISQIILNDGKTYDRIAVGDEYDFYYGIEDETLRCHDCNALMGEYHHDGCDCEKCPKCHEQLFSCEC